MTNESTLLHNLNPDEFFSRLKELVTDTVKSISPQILTQNFDELMTPDEVAKYFKKHKDTIANWTKKKFLIKHGIGDAVYYKRLEVESAVIALKV